MTILEVCRLNEVGLFRDDLRCRLTLAIEGVGRHHRAAQVKQIDQLLHGGNLVGLLRDRPQRNAQL